MNKSLTVQSVVFIGPVAVLSIIYYLTRDRDLISQDWYAVAFAWCLLICVPLIVNKRRNRKLFEASHLASTVEWVHQEHRRRIGSQLADCDLSDIMLFAQPEKSTPGMDKK